MERERSGSYGDLSLRQRITELLEEREMGARELSVALGIPEKEVYAHLPHVARSAGGRNRRFLVTPAQCRTCGYLFRERRRLTRPGRCPRCKRSYLRGPVYRIV